MYIKPSELPQKNYITSFEIFPTFAEQLNDIKINYFLKDTLFFDFDFALTKKIFFRADTQGIQLAPSHRIIGNVSVNPEYAFCYGAAKNIKFIPDTMFLKIPFENIEGEMEESIPIDTFERHGIKLNISEVSVKLEARKLKKFEKKVKVEERNFPSNYHLSKDSVTFVYYVDPKLDTFKEEKVTIISDFFNKRKNAIVPQVVRCPKYVTDYESLPSMPLKKISNH